jgi:eukaryotic-like serine/threonine-protein kinase
MEALLRPGHRLRLERAGAVLQVGERIGEGGQGVVHEATMDSARFAVKWYRQGPYTDQLRDSIISLVQRGQPPHPAFVWPIDMAVSDRVSGFGYVMRLLEPRFVSIPQVLNREMQPSFRVMAVLGRELVDAFAALHSSGLCYRDISFGNLRVDPVTAEVAIIDIDNIGTDGAKTLVKGTGRFMAPEIVRNEAMPTTSTDLHSLAVLLFYLFMHGHPLMGSRTDSSLSWQDGVHISETELTLRTFGTMPLFVFDPDDDANRPVPGDRMTAWWEMYPDFLREVFTRAFTSGLTDASLFGRVVESVWRRALLRLQGSVFECAGCGAAVLYDPDNADRQCWGCDSPLPKPPLLVLPQATLVIAEGAVLTGDHLRRDRDYRSVRAMVETHPGRPGRFVLRNMTDRSWDIFPHGEEAKSVLPGQRMGVRPMTIDFGSVRGRVV